MNRLLVVTPLVAVALALALPAVPCRAQPVPWNEDRVTELAGELADVVVQLQVAFRQEPSQHVGLPVARATRIP
jgi:hypothetical protein